MSNWMNSIHFRSRYIIEKEMEMVVVVVEAVVAAIKNKSKIALRVGPSHSQITVGNIASVGIITEQLEYLYTSIGRWMMVLKTEPTLPIPEATD